MQRVAEFREVFDGEADINSPELPEHRRVLISEEAGEAAEALTELARALDAGADPADAYKAVAKELADVLYVTYGTADVLGIDLPAVFDEVHRSNMSKRSASGQVLRRPDGKVLKGPDYRPPSLDDVVWPSALS